VHYGPGPTGVSTPTPSRFHLVALPFAPEVAVHEVAHNATLHLAPAAGNNPLWLWESVALFEAGQLVPPSSLPDLVAGRFPSFEALDRGATGVSVYDVGFTIAEFVVDRWGIDGLRRLILAFGDSSAALGVSRAELERGWRDFVTERYL
jgi:hypothetical protein